MKYFVKLTLTRDKLRCSTLFNKWSRHLNIANDIICEYVRPVTEENNCVILSFCFQFQTIRYKRKLVLEAEANLEFCTFKIYKQFQAPGDTNQQKMYWRHILYICICFLRDKRFKGYAHGQFQSPIIVKLDPYLKLKGSDLTWWGTPQKLNHNIYIAAGQGHGWSRPTL